MFLMKKFRLFLLIVITITSIVFCDLEIGVVKKLSDESESEYTINCAAVSKSVCIQETSECYKASDIKIEDNPYNYYQLKRKGKAQSFIEYPVTSLNYTVHYDYVLIFYVNKSDCEKQNWVSSNEVHFGSFLACNDIGTSLIFVRRLCSFGLDSLFSVIFTTKPLLQFNISYSIIIVVLIISFGFICIFLSVCYCVGKSKIIKDIVVQEEETKEFKLNKSSVCKIIWGYIKGTIMFLLMEIKSFFLLYFVVVSSSSFQIPYNSVLYGPFLSINLFIQTVITLILFIVKILEMIVFIIWMNPKHLLNPFKVCFFYSCFHEHLYYRLVKSFLFSICLVLFVFTFMGGLIAGEILDTLDLETSIIQSIWNVFLFFTKHLIPVIFLILELSKVLSYDSIGSVVFIDKIKKISTFTFPKVKISLLKALNINPENVISEVMFCICLLGDKSVEEVKESSIYRHLNWKLIDGLSEEEISFLKYLFTDYKKNLKESYFADTFWYYKPLTKKWCRNCCSTCSTNRKISHDEITKVIEDDNEPKDESSQKLVELKTSSEDVKEEDENEVETKSEDIKENEPESEVVEDQTE